MKHIFKIGQWVWYGKFEQVEILQKRIENGHICYRVSGPNYEGIVNQNFLSL